MWSLGVSAYLGLDMLVQESATMTEYVGAKAISEISAERHRIEASVIDMTLPVAVTCSVFHLQFSQKHVMSHSS